MVYGRSIRFYYSLANGMSRSIDIAVDNGAFDRRIAQEPFDRCVEHRAIDRRAMLVEESPGRNGRAPALLRRAVRSRPHRSAERPLRAG